MKIGFSQTAEYTISGSLGTDFPKRLSEALCLRTDWNYLCIQKNDCYFLKPSFRNMPYINSFVPEIEIRISQNDGKTSLHMTGQPVKFIRIFIRIWFGFLLLMGALSLIAVAASGTDGLIFVLGCVVMGVFGYLLCEIGTKVTFRSVVEAIQKEFP